MTLLLPGWGYAPSQIRIYHFMMPEIKKNGLVMMVGDALSLRDKNRRFIITSAIINLFKFPHGTTVGIVVLYGMSRPNPSSAFHNVYKRHHNHEPR